MAIFLDPELREILRNQMNFDSGTNLAGQPQPGTYGYYTPDFSYGSYKIPYQDPTYSSGYEYARTIAGGMPFEDVVAPGMSFSPDQPMGYTQADLTPRFVGEGPVPVMPSAPTKGTPLEASYETMPYAPVGTPMPTPFPEIPDYLKVDQNLFNFEEIADNIDMDKVAEIDIEKIDIPESVSLFSDILNEPVSTPYRPEGMSDKFAEQLADKGVDLTDPSSYMYMDLRGGGSSPGIGEILKMMPKPIQPMPVIPETLLMPQVSTPINNPLVNANSSPIKFDESTGNINFFSNASSPFGAMGEASNYLTPDQINSGKVNINYQPVPESERVVGTKSQTKDGVLQYKIETMADGSKKITNKDGSVTIEPAPPPVLQTPAFVQPNIDEIVRPISRQNKFSTQQPGLFNLV